MRRLQTDRNMREPAKLASIAPTACMYDSQLLRFASRDPINYEGSKWGLYEFLGGSVLLKVDPFGEEGVLGPSEDRCYDRCKGYIPRTNVQCCTSPGIDQGHQGGIVCCDGRTIVCVWNQNINSPVSKTAKAILADCVLAHEAFHLPDVTNCRSGRCETQLERGTMPWWRIRASECRAYTRELYCLVFGRSKCKGDIQCLMILETFIDDVKRAKRTYCN